MQLFVPIVSQDKWHPNFSSVLHPTRLPECELLQQWADGFIDRDGKFVHEFQTTFNSSFWEIYLFALFRSYGISVDWSRAAPDFCLNTGSHGFIVEATTANAAQGKPNEWDRPFSSKESVPRRFKALNTEAMIRLSSAIHAKHEKFERSYKGMGHVTGKPFVLAVAPFEQPHFNLQYDRAIRAVLYDYYVDEDAYNDDPARFPLGPPGVSLNRIYKGNGAPIKLGLFNSDVLSSVSAVIFSCVATWGKLGAMSTNPYLDVFVGSVWASSSDGAPVQRLVRRADHFEEVWDGLQIFHNPNAKNPLDPAIFRRDRVVQHYVDAVTGDWVYEGRTSALLHRQTMLFQPA